MDVINNIDEQESPAVYNSRKNLNSNIFKSSKKSKKKKKKSRKRSKVVLVSLVTSLIVSLVVASLSLALGIWMGGNADIREALGLEASIFTNTTKNGTLTVSSTEEESAIINAVDKNDPSVVSITVSANVPQMRSFINPFFGEEEQPTQRQLVGSGSGFIVSEDGLIVTNKHVVQGYEEAEYSVFTTEADQELTAKVVAIDPKNDLALLDIEGDNFKPVTLGTSNSLKVGQTVIAIGNAIGQFSNTVSKGVISGLQREIVAGDTTGRFSEQLTNIIQTDAAINPGNSGGPLININGEVIGVNTAVAQGSENIGFAIPIAEVTRALESYNTDGEIIDDRGFLGVQYVMVTEQIKADNDLKVDNGALILGEGAIVPNSPADEADFKVGDVIIEIDGEKINSENSLAEIVGNKKAGDDVEVVINRDGDDIEKKVTLTNRPDSQ